jgi:16S rRNA (guanine527-N7)-methyltransferase
MNDVNRENAPDQGKLDDYAALVRYWAPRLDLVSPGDLERLEERHIADCLRLAPLLDELPEGPCIDVGSGAGLPGIPLAIARATRPWRLLEPRARRAAFLEEVVRSLDLTCEVVPLSAEQAALDARFRGVHALGAARALAPPAEALSLVAPLVRVDGVTALFVGSQAKLPPRAALWAPGIAIIRLRGD